MARSPGTIVSGGKGRGSRPTAGRRASGARGRRFARGCAVRSPASAQPARLAAASAAVNRLGDVGVAVRSSAIAEDLPGASFAGQYETILGSRGAAEIADAIETCPGVGTQPAGRHLCSNEGNRCWRSDGGAHPTTGRRRRRRRRVRTRSPVTATGSSSAQCAAWASDWSAWRDSGRVERACRQCRMPARLSAITRTRSA